jgi:hypothetical protein
LKEKQKQNGARIESERADMIHKSDCAHFDVDCQIASHREEIEHLCREFEINSACDTPSVSRLERGVSAEQLAEEAREGGAGKKRKPFGLELGRRRVHRNNSILL